MTPFSTLRRTTKPINRVSAKRRGYEAEFERMKPFVRSLSGGWCEAGRTRGRSGGNDLANLLDLCGPCHQWAHENPILATAWGLLVPSYEDPDVVPVWQGQTP